MLPRPTGSDTIGSDVPSGVVSLHTTAKAGAVRPLRRRPIATAVVAAAAALALGGCSDTNFSAQTNQAYQAGIGANHQGDIDVLNTLLVANPDGSATVSAGVVNHNEGEDAVTGVTATTLAGDTLTVNDADKDLALPSESIVPLGKEGGAGVYTVDGAPIGQYVRLTVSFADSASVTIEAPVVTRGEYYDDISLG